MTVTRVSFQERGTVAEILKQNGYATAWIGKNHNTPAWETSEVGPFDHWPSGLGFDYFYGFNGGDTSQFEPVLVENHNRVPRSTDPTTTYPTTSLITPLPGCSERKEIDPARPFFLLCCPRRPHAHTWCPRNGVTSSKASLTWAGTAIER